MAEIWRYRGWIWSAAVSDLRHRYAGSGLGVLWNVISPLATLSIYLFVFTQVMDVRRASFDGISVPFPLYLASGFLPWLTFSDGLTRTTQTFITNSVHLKRMAIPEIVFVAQTAASACISMVIALVLLLAVALAFGEVPMWSWLLLPVVIALWQLFTFGIGLALSAINVFFRDVGQILIVVLQVWFWSLPVVYFEEVLPPAYRALMQFNPAYPFLTSLRTVLFEGWPAPTAWISMGVWTLAVVAAGHLVLTRLQPEIRDLL